MKTKNNFNNNLFSMKNKNVLIFGGAGKLGSQFKKVLENYGANVFILDKTISLKSKKLNYFKCDVANEKSVINSFTKILKTIEKIDVVIYNVYSKPKNYYQSFEKYDTKTWKNVVDTNLTGAFFVSQSAINSFLKNNVEGNIIFLSSTYGLVGPYPNLYKGLSSKKNIYGGKFSLNTPAAYSSTKSGLFGLSKYIATSFGKYNIRSNILSPGGVFDNQEKKFVHNYKSKVPLNRMANWSDYDGAILFLSSDASKYMTGSNLVVDGGWTAW